MKKINKAKYSENSRLVGFPTVSTPPTITTIIIIIIYTIYFIYKGAKMKIIFNREQILNAIAPLMCAVSNKSTLSSIEGVLIQTKAPDICILTTYDLEKGLRTTIDARVIEEGCYIINAQKFNQTVRAMNGEEILLTINEKLQTSIDCGISSHKMNALEGSDFPEIPNLTSDLSFELKQSVLKKMFSKISYAMAVNDQRLVLNGCYLKVTNDSLQLVSCDTFKLAKCATKTEIVNKNADGIDLKFAFIVPTKTVNDLLRLLSDNEEKIAHIYMMRKHFVIIIGEFTFFSRLIEGEYIDYERIIIKSHKITLKTDREEFINALERAALVTEEKIAGSLRSYVKLEIVSGVIKISANSTAGSTYDEINTEHDGADIVIGFNNRYLIDSVKACDSEKIKISMSSPLTSINIQPLDEEEKDETFMLLPVRMKE